MMSFRLYPFVAMHFSGLGPCDVVCRLSPLLSLHTNVSCEGSKAGGGKRGDGALPTQSLLRFGPPFFFLSESIWIEFFVLICGLLPIAYGLRLNECKDKSCHLFSFTVPAGSV